MSCLGVIDQLITSGTAGALLAQLGVSGEAATENGRCARLEAVWVEVQSLLGLSQHWVVVGAAANDERQQEEEEYHEGRHKGEHEERHGGGGSGVGGGSGGRKERGKGTGGGR